MSTPRCILVVDDDADIRDFVEMALSVQGCQVVTATDGAAALALVATQTPDVILLDMLMPIMDGWEFARRYRTQAQRRAPVPIIVMTAALDAAQRAQDIAADGVLPKPFSLLDLYGAIGPCLPA